MKTLKMTFTTEGGKKFAFSLNYADPALLEEGGAARIKSAADLMLALQPFDAGLISFDSAVFIDRSEHQIEMPVSED